MTNNGDLAIIEIKWIDNETGHQYKNIETDELKALQLANAIDDAINLTLISYLVFE